MSREIKFRAWIKKEYDQCGGFMLYDPDNESTDYFMVSNGNGFAVVFDEDWLKDGAYEIMQFTGLTDKNGKEIFEGDCVRFEIHDGAVVIWNEVNACFEFKAIKHYCESDISLPCEVIGNIHEHSHLLD